MRSEELSQEILDKLKERLAIERDSIKTQEANLQNAKRYLERVQSLGNSLEENNIKRHATANFHQAQIDYYEKVLKLGDANSAQISKDLKKEREKLKQVERQVSAASQLQEKMEGMSIANSKFMGTIRLVGAAMEDGPGSTFKLFTSMAAGPVFGQLKKGFGMLKKSVIDVMFAVDNATHAFQRQTGMGEKYNAGMKQNYLETRRFGATMEDVSKQTQTLIGTVSDFSLESAQAGTRVAQTGVLLEKLGVQGEDFAKGIQNSMKMFGQSMMPGEQTARELLETSKALGIEPKKLAGDYAKMGGQLAKLGRDGPQAFKELARVSKITGMEMEKILAVTNKFDTFESAAEMTGKLNAALGGNFVNAMDMMMDTDPVSRFEKMRDAISQTGLTFDDMSYYQKQFYAESMGLSDVGDLALMMSGNMDMMSGATQKSAADYRYGGDPAGLGCRLHGAEI